MSDAKLVFDWRGLVVPVAFVAAAEIAARVTGYESSLLSSPSAIVAAFWTALLDGTLLRATLSTLATSLAGLAIGTCLGLMFGPPSWTCAHRGPSDGILH